MASTSPFIALTGATTTGKTVKVTANNTPTSVAGSVDSTGGDAPSIYVFNAGTTGGGTGCIVFVRMSAEATPTAAATDFPIAPNTGRVFSNPVPLGKLGVAALSITTTANDVYFTPGQGGI